MAARLLLSPSPQRCRKPQCSSAEKSPPPRQRSLREFCLSPASPVKDGPASSVQDLPASSVQTVQKRKYGARGTCGTFAGKRPPKDEKKLKQFQQDREEHMQRLQPTSQCRKRQSTEAQQQYRDFVKEMLPHEMQGSGKERLVRVAAKWKNHLMTPEKLAQENRSVA